MKTLLEFESAEDILSLLNYGSMKQLHAWAKDGWPPGIETINDLLSEMSLNIQFKQDIAQAVEGLFFDIGLVCSDIPEHWFNPQPISRGSFNCSEPLENDTPIQIGINIGKSSSPSLCLERGAAVSVLIMYLVERFKRPVVLKQFYSIENAEHSFAGSLTIKQHEEVLNVDNLSFWLCCPGVADCWTRIIEDTPCLQNLTKLEPKYIPTPDLQYGKHGMDIFISVNEENETWTRQDSISWITDMVGRFKDNS